jgi:protein-S-isoprenylcysteine O-methyltransferase Ste14
MMKWHDMPKKEDMPFIPIVITLVVIIGWAVVMLLDAVFWSSNLNLFQNIVILILSGIIVACVLGIVWMAWVSRYTRKNAEYQPPPPPPSSLTTL